MPPRHVSDLHDLGVDILGTTLSANGALLAQTGDVVAGASAAAGAVSSDNAEVWCSVNVLARPARPDVGKAACQAITINQGSNDIIIATRDLRAASLHGTVGEGETSIIAPGPTNHGTGQILMQDDGSLSTITIKTNHLLNLGGTGGDPVALAPAIQNYATDLVVLLVQIVGALSTLAPGAITVNVPTLSATVVADKARATHA